MSILKHAVRRALIPSRARAAFGKPALFKRILDRFDEPRFKRITWTIKYLCVVVLGAIVITCVPYEIPGWGIWLTDFGGWMMVAGGMSGIFLVPKHNWGWEKLSVLLSGLGLGIYLILLIFGVPSLMTDIPWQGVVLTVGGLLSLVDRWVDIKKFSY